MLRVYIEFELADLLTQHLMRFAQLDRVAETHQCSRKCELSLTLLLCHHFLAEKPFSSCICPINSFQNELTVGLGVLNLKDI